MKSDKFWKLIDATIGFTVLIIVTVSIVLAVTALNEVFGG